MKIHKSLASGRWFEFSLLEQLANVGTDVERAIQWNKKGNKEYSQKAFERALELLTLLYLEPEQGFNCKRYRKMMLHVYEILKYL